MILSFVWRVLFLLLFNFMFFFYGGTQHRDSVWLSYGFIHFSYLAFLFIPAMAGRGVRTADLMNPIYTISSLYFFIELIVGLVFIFMKSESTFAAMLIQGIGASIYLMLIIANIKANARTIQSQIVQVYEQQFITNTTTAIRRMMEQVKYTAKEKLLEKLYDQIKASPSNSCDEVKHLEISIQDRVNFLKSAVNAGDDSEISSLVDETLMLVDDRNRTLKNLN